MRVEIDVSNITPLKMRIVLNYFYYIIKTKTIII